MKKSVLHTLVAGALVAACSPSADVAQKTTTAAESTQIAEKSAALSPLAALFEAYWEEQAKLFPLEATAQGDNRYNDQLPNDQTRAFRQHAAAVLPATT